MRIGLNDIEPRIAHEIKTRLVAPKSEMFWTSFWFPLGFTWLRKRRRPKEEQHLVELVREREAPFLWRVEATFALPAILAIFAAVFLLSNNIPGDWATFDALALWAGATGFGTWRTAKYHPLRQLKRHVTLEEMRAIFPILRLTRAERIYCDALEMLARTETDAETGATMRDALKQLNDLLRNSRLLDTRRVNLLSIMGMNSIPELQAEFGALGRKLDTTTDTVTRQSLQQSLQMCAARIENARSIEQNMERLHSQQEAIVQTLATALSSMARLQAAPDVQSEAAAHEIAATVAQMNQQTYSVEQAVEEVITLRNY